MNLWKKHLGMLIDDQTTGVQKEVQAPDGIQIDKPLSLESINGVLALARRNALTYQRVFLHVPSNNHDAMTTGRSLAFPVLDPKKGTHDFSKPAALAPEFMSGIKQDIDNAHKELRANIRGFFVEMPLDWGANQGQTPRPPLNQRKIIAERGLEKNGQKEFPA